MSELRLGDADRDGLAATLGRHYVEGRFDAGELARRLDVVYGAERRDDAAAAIADLPPLAAPERRRRGRRHGEAPAAEATWLPTKERFLDPSTQRVMRVWVDPADGSRHYVAEPRWHRDRPVLPALPRRARRQGPLIDREEHVERES